MDNLVSISIVLDKRRVKSNNKYPVRLRVFTKTPRRQKLYPTIFDFNEKEFNTIWNGKRLSSDQRQINNQLKALELKANKAANGLDFFSFELFEKHMFRKQGEGTKVKYHYNQAINNLKSRNQINTANTYELSLKSIKSFLGSTNQRNIDSLDLSEIDVNFLKDYEFWMTEINDKSVTTVSIYLRVLRTIFNNAISDNEINSKFYPFGKRKYQVPATNNVKKALDSNQLKEFFNSKPETIQQEKAKDFWFLSFACSGINIKDLALLRQKNIDEGKIEFVRAKTKLTSKGNLKPITIYINEFSEYIIRKYGRLEKGNNDLIFDIISDRLTPSEKHNRIKNFTRFINQHIKKIAKKNGLPEEISTYWARHSYATNSIRKGARMEFMQEALGHSDTNTTKKYFSGFDDEIKKEFSQNVMDFK